MRALIVEDDLVSQRLMQSIVSPVSSSCEVAGDGEEGFRLYLHAFDSGNPFDVVFLDVMMPEANGQEVLAAIREFEKEQDISVENGVPVIMTTALDDGINLYQAHANGCVDYIVKPLSREKILKALQRLGLSTSTTSQGS